MHVALDRGQHDLAARGDVARLGLLRLHVRQEVGDRLLHHARALHHLRQEHLAGAEEIADDVHPVHQRPFDDGERARIGRARFLDVGVEMIDDPLHERMREALLDGSAARRRFLLFDLLRLSLYRVGVREQALGRIGAVIEQHVFDEREQVLWNLLVNCQLSRVDNAHRQSRFDGVIQKRGVHGLANGLVSAE